MIHPTLYDGSGQESFGLSRVQGVPFHDRVTDSYQVFLHLTIMLFNLSALVAAKYSRAILFILLMYDRVGQSFPVARIVYQFICSHLYVISMHTCVIYAMNL